MSLPTLVKLTVGAVAGAALLAVPASGQAQQHSAGSSNHPLGWHPYRTADASFAAGDVCGFALQVKVVFDREYVRDEHTYPDSSPRLQDYSGPLVVRLTNLQSGRSVVKDLSAYGTFRYARSGALTLDAYGPVGVGFHPGDGEPAGYYVLAGYHRIHIDPGGVKTITIDQGTEENVCDEIG